jgi:putative ABC transport system permease protein
MALDRAERTVMKPPLLGRVLLRLMPLGDRRDSVEGDLLELFDARVASHGRRRASVRFIVDVVSFAWRRESPPLRRGLPRLPLQGFGHDLVYGIRVFSKRPTVVMLTILGLGLAIGVCGSVFSLVNAELLRGDGVVDSDRAPRVMKRSSPSSLSDSWSYAEYDQMRAAATSAQLHAWAQDRTTFRFTAGIEEPPGANVAFVDGGFLSGLGAQPHLGRLLAPSDDVPGAPPAAVLNYAFWSRELAADPTIVGRTIWLGRGAFTVVGVANRGFSAPAPSRAAFWLPLSTYGLVYDAQPRGPIAPLQIAVVARVPRDMALKGAEAELSGIAAALQPTNDPQKRIGALFDVDSRLGRPHFSRVLPVIAVVAGVLGLILLLACVNVTTVLLASATTRQREMAVRLALGASRWRIMRQLLTESVLLGAAAGVVGLLITIWLAPTLASAIRMPGPMELRPDLTVYAFFATVTMLAGVGAGLAPSRLGARGDVVTPLKGDGASPSAAAPRRMRSTLLGVQAAASILLLVMATLLTRATIRAAHVDVGFDADRLLSVSVGFGRSTSKERIKAYFGDVMERVLAIPGVDSAALTAYPPFGNGSMVQIDEMNGDRFVTYFHRTDAKYFETAGLQILRGRSYTAEEVRSGAAVALISESAARRFWRDDDPLGSSLARLDGEDKAIVIGVVRDAITARLRDLSAAAIYRPTDQQQIAASRLLIRTNGRSDLAVRSVTQAIRAVDPTFTVRVERVADGLAEELEAPQLLALVSAMMAAMALVLAGIGIYGITAAVVGQRTREIGVRLAIGAERRDVLRLLVGDSLRPVLVGGIAGVVAALLATRVLKGVLFGVPPHDPVAFAGAVTLLTIAALAAVIVPTRRASQVDPAFVLRQS